MPCLPVMNFSLGACSKNNGKVDEEKHYHAEDLDARSGVLVPGKPFRGEAEEENGGKDEKRDWRRVKKTPVQRRAETYSTQHQGLRWSIGERPG